jgi:hypothetical protein
MSEYMSSYLYGIAATVAPGHSSGICASGILKTSYPETVAGFFAG